jgi:hypothetical protein
MPVVSRPTMRARMVSVPSKVSMATRPATCLTTWWSSRMPLPPSMASARRHRFTDIRDTRNRRATSPVAGAGLDQLRRSQPHPLAAGPFRGGQPAAIGILHGSGIARCAGHHQSQ